MLTDVKNPLASRTVWANLLGFAALVLPLVGVDTTGVEPHAFAEAVATFVAAGSFIASTVFRVIATNRLRG